MDLEAHVNEVLSYFDNNHNLTLHLAKKILQPELHSTLTDFINKGQTRAPVIIEFDPTTNCNYSCPECISSRLLNKGEISGKHVAELIISFAEIGVRGIIFIGGGEPLAHTSMPLPITQAHQLGLQVGLSSNGILIHKFLENLAQSLSWLRVSVDAGTSKVYNLIRPSGITNVFKKVLSNIESYARVKKGRLGYSFLLVQRHRNNIEPLTNFSEIYEAGKIAKNSGCDYFEVKPMVDQEHHLVPLNIHQKERIIAQLEKSKQLQDDNFHVFLPGSINHILTSQQIPDQPKAYHTCHVLQFRTLYTPTGIYPCPYKRGFSECKIGEIDQTIKDYWNSQDRLDAQNRIDPSVDCSFHCVRHETNVLLNSLIDANSQGLDLLNLCDSNNLTGDIFI